MQSDSNNLSHFVPEQNYSQARKYLIPRSQSRKFLLRFTFMTLLGWVVGGIASLALEKALNELDVSIWKILSSYLGNILFAVIFAADQALVLRPYLSIWLWMLATSAGWLIANGVAAAWGKYIFSIALSLNVTLSPETRDVLGVLSTISYVMSGLLLGICQWLVLRKYTKSAWWWAFIPAISFFFISLLMWVLSLLQDFLPVTHRTSILYWSGQVLTAVILGVIPAISLCSLKKNYNAKLQFLVHPR